jgi:hypothetical protein
MERSVERRSCLVDFGDWPLLELTGFRTFGNLSYGTQAEQPTCPKCEADLILALPPGGKGQRKFQCFDCDRLDPLKTDKVTGWLAGELGRAELHRTE